MPNEFSDLVRSIKVLIVEDNPDQAESLRRVLESRTEIKYTVDTVRTLSEATRRLDENGIDAVLLDLRLPDGPRSPKDVVRTIADRYPNVGIVAMTGWSGPEIEEPVKEAGAGEVLIKPASPVDVSTKLQQVVIYRRYNRRKAVNERMLSELANQLLTLNERSNERPSSTRPGDRPRDGDPEHG